MARSSPVAPASAPALPLPRSPTAPPSRRLPNRASRPLVDRVSRIHEVLQQGRPQNCTQLSERLGVCTKTVHRDLDYMRDRLGLPLVYDARTRAYRYTEAVHNLPLVQMTEGELLALLVASKAVEQYRGTPYQRQLEMAFQKLEGLLDHRISFRPEGALDRHSFHQLGIAPTDLAAFETLSRALLQNREVRFDYRKPQEPRARRRRVRPYHLACRQQCWYLIAFDLERGAIRNFALPRLKRPEMLATTFAPPTDFDPATYFGRTLGAFVGTGDFKVRLRFAATAAEHVRERFWHESQVLETRRDGCLDLTLHLGDLEEVERWVLSWGDQVTVLAPAPLRRRVEDTVKRLAKLYR